VLDPRRSHRLRVAHHERHECDRAGGVPDGEPLPEDGLLQSDPLLLGEIGSTELVDGAHDPTSSSRNTSSSERNAFSPSGTRKITDRPSAPGNFLYPRVTPALTVNRV